MKFAYCLHKESVKSQGHDFIALLKSKNEKAFSDLYSIYSSRLLGYINKITSSSPASEDILQNVFVKVWTHIETYSSEKSSLFTWITTIARNEAIDHYRSLKSRATGRTTPLENCSASICQLNVNTTRLDVWKSLSYLNVKEQAIMRLYFHGFGCREIGTLLMMPEGTVKTRMRSVYKRLQILLS